MSLPSPPHLALRLLLRLPLRVRLWVPLRVRLRVRVRVLLLGPVPVTDAGGTYAQPSPDTTGAPLNPPSFTAAGG